MRFPDYNKVVPKDNDKKSKKSKYKVPVFKCMLAKDSKGHEKKLVGEKLIDYKLDGVRVVTIVNPISKTVKHYSRNGKEFHNFGHITKHIENFLTKRYPRMLLAATCAFANEYLKDDAEKAYWTQIALAEIDQAMRESDFERQGTLLTVATN